MQWFKPGTSFDFIGRSRLFLTFSACLVAAGLALFGVRALTRGSMLNYGTDFRGGSEVQVQFARAIDVGKLRAALDAAGYRGAEVVRMQMPGRDHFFLIRLAQASAYTEPQIQAARAKLEAKLGAGKVARFQYAEGDKVHVRFAEAVEPQAIAAAFSEAGVATRAVDPFGRTEDHAFQVTLGGLDAEIERNLDERLGAGTVKEIPQVESVGAKVGAELRRRGFASVGWTLILILVYIGFRFSFEFAPGAVIALLHDVLIVAALFSLLWKDFTLQTVAALLTVGGYSINDTIVIFDRIRENLGRMRDRKLPVLVNASLNETLNRTIMTALTTTFATLAVWYFTRGPVRDFALAITVGIVIGTYSSIAVASPLYIHLHERLAARKSR